MTFDEFTDCRLVTEHTTPDILVMSEGEHQVPHGPPVGVVNEPPVVVEYLPLYHLW